MILAGRGLAAASVALSPAPFAACSRCRSVPLMPGRGHSLTIDAGWQEVAEKALEFVKRFT